MWNPPNNWLLVRSFSLVNQSWHYYIRQVIIYLCICIYDYLCTHTQTQTRTVYSMSILLLTISFYVSLLGGSSEWWYFYVWYIVSRPFLSELLLNPKVAGLVFRSTRLIVAKLSSHGQGATALYGVHSCICWGLQSISRARPVSSSWRLRGAMQFCGVVVSRLV